MRRCVVVLGCVVALLVVGCSGDDGDARAVLVGVDGESGTIPQSGVGDGVWTYDDLDGRSVTVRQSESTPFAGELPVPVALIDQRANSGCLPAEAEYDFWVGMVDDPAAGERASAYARYTLDKGADLECAFAS